MTVSNENSHDLVSVVKSKLDIVDLISKYVDLKRSSRTLKGLCPFYPENTPSFVVYPEEQTFKCFCGLDGEVNLNTAGALSITESP